MELSKTVIPKYMTEINNKIAMPVCMSEFLEKGVGKATALKNLKLGAKVADTHKLSLKTATQLMSITIFISDEHKSA